MLVDRLKIEGIEYNTDDLSEQGKQTLEFLRFAIGREKELERIQSIMQRAKNSYIDSLKKEILSEKAGLLLED